MNQLKGKALLWGVLVLAACTASATDTLVKDVPEALTSEPREGMVFVPGGSFVMGSDPADTLAECEAHFIGGSCDNDLYRGEFPQHDVLLSSFYIDTNEVTNAQYAECVTATVCDAPDRRGSVTRPSYYGNAQFDNYPVIWVSWEDANTYCAWRGARLPSEAEWEKAARGTDARLYPWGDTFDGTRANFCDRNCTQRWANRDVDDGYADTAPVGSYALGVSPYGAYDMAGNVDEWVNDWHDADYYADAPRENPSGPVSGERRAMRGGAWHGPGHSVRTAARPRSDPSADYIGFRCARDE